MFCLVIKETNKEYIFASCRTICICFYHQYCQSAHYAIMGTLDPNQKP